MQSLTHMMTLSNGVEIPCVGFGTWQTESGELCVQAVRTALECGYRHIDGAAIYQNEVSVGQGIRESGVPRDQIFVTSKSWNSERGYEKVQRACEKSLTDLGLDYLDLYLIHWPLARGEAAAWQETNADTWRGFEKLCRDGKVRSIGLSNFLPQHIEPLLATAEIPPMVAQIEFHPGYMQREAVDYCKAHNILVQAWSPIGSGRLLDDPTLSAIAGEYGKSVAQLCIRWCMQHGVLPLPKSQTPSRIVENAQVFDFVISDEHMAQIDAMPELGFSGLHPDRIDF